MRPLLGGATYSLGCCVSLLSCHNTHIQVPSFCVCTGEWSHWSRVTKFPTRRWLSDVSISARTGRPTVFNRRTAGTTATSAIVSDASAHGIRSMRGVVHRSFEDIVSEFTFDPEGECEPDLNKNGSSTKTHPLARILASAREYVALSTGCSPCACGRPALCSAPAFVFG